MKGHMTNLLWTAGAVVVGIVVAKMVNDKLLAKGGATASSTEDEE